MREAQARLSSPEFTEELAFDRIYPMVEERIDLAAAIVASTVANAMGGKRDGGSFTPADFLPDYAAAYREPQSADVDEDAIAAQVSMMFGAMAKT